MSETVGLVSETSTGSALCNNPIRSDQESSAGKFAQTGSRLLDLPVDRSRAERAQHAQKAVAFCWDSNLVKGLKELAANEDASIEHALLAVFLICLYRWTNQQNLVLDWVPAAGQRSSTETSWSFLLRMDVSGEQSVSELLRAAGQAMREAVARPGSEMTPGQVMFRLEDHLRSSHPAVESAGAAPGGTANNPHELALVVREHRGTLCGRMEYAAELFDARTVQRMLDHYRTVLVSALADPAAAIGRLEMLPESERRRVLYDWNQTVIDHPESKCIHDLFQEQAKRTPDKVAVVFEDQLMTYRELDEKSDVLAARLRRLGVGPDVRVGVFLERSLDLVIGLYGIHKAGGAYVPLDPIYPPDRLRFIIEDSQVALLLTHRKLAPIVPKTDSTILCIDDNWTEAQTLAVLSTSPNQVSPENLAYVIYTSGSTGKPKGVMVRHRNVVNFFVGMDQVLGGEPGVWLAVTSICFDISVLELFWTLIHGYKVVLHEDPAAAMRLRNLVELRGSANPDRFSLPQQIRIHGVTHLQCTPSFAGMMIQDPGNLEVLRRIKTCLFGGEPLPLSLVQKLTGVSRIFNLYGPTETTVWSTVNEVKPGSERMLIGRPLANTQVYILDRYLQPVPVGVIGELFIGGAGVTRGYLNRADLTKERFVNDYFSGVPGARLYRTGDLARYCSDGKIEFLGRSDHQVKYRGFRIELGEIESVMREFPGVSDSVVSLWEPGSGDQRLVGYFVVQPGHQVDADGLKHFLKRKLPDYMVPSLLRSLSAIPLTPNGKTDRKALPGPLTKEMQETKMKAAKTTPESKPSSEEFVPDAPPLTPAQREIWYASQMSDGLSCSFNLSATVRLDGRLELPRLQRALDRLVARHDALRVTFAAHGERQLFHTELPMELQFLDLAGLSPAAQEQRLQAALRHAVGVPFDLVGGPLCRAVVIRLESCKHLFCLTAHHLICDGYSLQLLLQELGALYSAESCGRPCDLKVAPSFAKFVIEQARLLSSSQGRVVEDFWVRQFSNPVSLLELPIDHARSLNRTFVGGSEPLRLGLELSRQVKDLSARQRCSLGTTMLAGYYLWLRGLSRQTEIVVGLPMTSRYGEEAELLVGHCVNFLPLRLEIPDDTSFLEHLVRVRDLLVRAHQHQNYTLGSLLQKLNIPRVPGRMPLASVMFNFDWALGEVAWDDLEANVGWNPFCFCQFDLSLSVAESEGELQVRCQYAAELFEPRSVQVWLEQFRVLLADVVVHSDQSVRRLLSSWRNGPSSRVSPFADELRTAQASVPNELKAGSESCKPKQDAEASAGHTGPDSPEMRGGGAQREANGNGNTQGTGIEFIQEKLAQIWKEVILVPAVSPSDDFFDLGGHSLLATQVIARITKAFNIDLPLRTIFEAPTLDKLAKAVAQAQREQPTASAIVPRAASPPGDLMATLDRLSDADLRELLDQLSSKDASS